MKKVSKKFCHLGTSYNLCKVINNEKQENMKTVIYKNENKAKTYRLTSKVNQGIYDAGDFIMNVKTDNIETFISESFYLFNIEII